MAQLISKPIEQMTIEELKQERVVHSWQAQKSERGAEALQKRLYWLEENKPIRSREEIQRAYEDGELTQAQYQTAFANRATAINYRRRAENEAQYSRTIAKEERALLAQIDERILQLEATAPRPRRGRPPKRDPRKRATAKRKTYRQPRNIKSLKRRWQAIDSSNKSSITQMQRLAPVPQWNRETLSKIAFDRGYFTQEALIYDIANELEISYTATAKALKSGKFTFGQILLIGAMLEMTPIEFCDTFLYGYFQDITNGYGSYVATVRDKQPLLDKPIKSNNKAV